MKAPIRLPRARDGANANAGTVAQESPLGSMHLRMRSLDCDLSQLSLRLSAALSLPFGRRFGLVAFKCPRRSAQFLDLRLFGHGPVVHPSKRYRLFFDETGNGDLRAAEKDPNQPRQDQHDSDTTKQLNTLKADVFGKKSVILHRREIIDAKGDFATLKDPQVRAKFNAEFAALVSRLSRPAFTVSIDKQEHLKKYKVWQFSPYHYALTCLLERFVLWLHYSGNVGDVMGEARGPKHDAQLRRAFRFFYKNGTKVKTEVIQTRLISRELRLQPKQANIAALQIADLLAHPAHRAYKFERLGIAQPDDYGTALARILREKTYHRSWFGRIEGYGRKWLP
jgi:hypothetical protein